MKRTILICFLLLSATLLSAQKIYFIYLQTESGEPFFIRMNDKLYSSTASGYLILSKLKDSTYNFKLGFPGKNIDIDFTTSINKKDHGYLIKNLGEKGWGLFDLQSLGLQMSAFHQNNSSQSDNSSNSQVNAFTEMLSKAVDDPSLKQNPVFAKEDSKKPDVVETIEKGERKPGITEAVVKEEKKSGVITQPITKPEEKKIESVGANEQIDSLEKNSTVKTGEIYQKSQVTKISGIATTQGFESVFIDEYQNGDKDTIRIVIPSENKEENREVIIKDERKPDSTKEAKKFLDIISDTAQVITKVPAETKKEEKKWWPFSKNKSAAAETKKCRTVAANDDFLKLRRKMATRTNDDGMLDEAKRYFKTKCFTTEQIKNLSSMFLSNAGKYNFFEIAYDYASDIENFSSLQSELNDEYYINQFKAMLRN